MCSRGPALPFHLIQEAVIAVYGGGSQAVLAGAERDHSDLTLNSQIHDTRR